MQVVLGAAEMQLRWGATLFIRRKKAIKINSIFNENIKIEGRIIMCNGTRKNYFKYKFFNNPLHNFFTKSRTFKNIKMSQNFKKTLLKLCKHDKPKKLLSFSRNIYFCMKLFVVLCFYPLNALLLYSLLLFELFFFF